MVEWAGSARVVVESTEIRMEWAGSARVIKLTEREREGEVVSFWQLFRPDWGQKTRNSYFLRGLTPSNSNTFFHTHFQFATHCDLLFYFYISKKVVRIYVLKQRVAK